VGDSPLIGAGNYADARVGAAACVGQGELAIRFAAARTAVMHVKAGKTPRQAAQAVVREVQEETGVVAEVEGVLGLRNRYDPEQGNGVYVVMLLRLVSGEPKADGREVDHAGFFTLDQIRELNPLPPVNWEIAQRVLCPDCHILNPKAVTNLNGARFTLFVG